MATTAVHGATRAARAVTLFAFRVIGAGSFPAVVFLREAVAGGGAVEPTEQSCFSNGAQNRHFLDVHAAQHRLGELLFGAAFDHERNVHDEAVHEANRPAHAALRQVREVLSHVHVDFEVIGAAVNLHRERMKNSIVRRHVI